MFRIEVWYGFGGDLGAKVSHHCKRSFKVNRFDIKVIPNDSEPLWISIFKYLRSIKTMSIEDPDHGDEEKESET